jgi:cyclophilin family peptidyl-prolyl cis-trans isomerase/HEAT repeat protein
MTRHRSRAPLALLCLAAACATPAPTPGPPTPAAITESDVDATQLRILRLEDRRSDGKGDLQRLALAGDPELRALAVRALGRLPFPEHGSSVTDALERGLEDPDPEVRALAAFGLGLRADPACADDLLRAMKDVDERVRARAVEAAGRLDEPSLREEVLFATNDPSALVRASAVTAPAAWDREAADAAVVDSTLANLAVRAPGELRRDRLGLEDSIAFAVEPEADEVIWRALFSLSRRRSDRGRLTYLLWCAPPAPAEARIFAMRGLAALSTADDEALGALRAGLDDPDWRVVVEAAQGLGRFPDAASVPLLEAALDHPVTGCRQAAATALGAFAEHRRLAQPALERALEDPSASVRAAALVGLARLFPQASAERLARRAADQNPLVRRAVAQATAHLNAPSALPLLARLVRDDDRAVAFAAAQGLGEFLDQGGRTLAQELLADPDPGLRLGAVLAVGRGVTPADLPHLTTCFRTTTGELAPEVRYEILEAVAPLRADGAFELLVLGTRAERSHTRQVARRLIALHHPGTSVPPEPPLAPLRGQVPPAALGQAPRPRVEIRTARGTLVFELHPEVAPLHVLSFLELVRSGTYDGLRFHRVVPDFVVQGGDPRGDGNGGRSWRGEPLRHEFNELGFLEGSLGMPRNDDPDSGGGQLFVTHRPTPHLDGRYTRFGQLVQGFELLPLIEEGDLILEARVRGE